MCEDAPYGPRNKLALSLKIVVLKDEAMRCGSFGLRELISENIGETLLGTTNRARCAALVPFAFNNYEPPILIQDRRVSLDSHDITVNVLLHCAHPITLMLVGAHRVKSGRPDRESIKWTHGPTVAANPGLCTLNGSCRFRRSGDK